MFRIAMTVLAAGLVFVSSGQETEDIEGTISVLLEEEGPQGVLEYIDGFSEDEQLELFSIARQVMVFGEWSQRNMEDLVMVSGAGIEKAMSMANSATDPSEIESLLDIANVMSFNLSADIAQCWPGDTLHRSDEVLQRGLSAALQCIEWRREMGKDDHSLYIAYWAAGMHQMSLNRPQESMYNLVQALNHAQQYTIDSGLTLGLCPSAGFDLILAHGYLGIAMEMCGMEDDQYERALSAFRRGMEEYPDRSNDYSFGIEQLEWARGNLIGDGQ